MMIPVAFVASLANLNNLAKVFPALTAYLDEVCTLCVSRSLLGRSLICQGGSRIRE